MRSPRQLAELLSIHPGEGRLVWRLFLFALSNGSARTLMRSAAYGLFLAAFSAQLLPYVYICVSLIAALASFGYMRAVRRVALARLLPATLLAVLLMFVALRLGLGAGAGAWLLFSLPIGYEVLLVMTNLALWNTAGQLMNVQQGKRLFGLVAAGEPVAAVAGGFLIAPLAGLIGVPNLLLLAAAAMLAALLIARALVRAYPAQLGHVAATPAAEIHARAGLGRNRYVLLTLALFALAIVSYFFIDNLFYVQTQAQLAGANQLAGFIGVFNAVVAIAWTITNAFVLGAVARRLGLRALLLGAPLLLALSTLAIVVAGGLGAALTTLFGLAALNKLLSKLSFDGFVKLGLNIVYQPLPAAQRAQAQALTEGVIYAGSVGLTGVLLLALAYLVQLSPTQLAGVLLATILAWLAVAALLLREYPRQLLRALARRTLGGGAPELTDPASRAVLRHALGDARPELAIYGLNTLAALGDDALPALLPGLLRHPAAAVRQQTLLVIEQRGDPAALDAVAALLAAEPSAAVRGDAIRVLATHRGNATLAQITPFLASPEPLVRLGATVGLLRGGGIAGILAAGQQLLHSAAAPSPDERIIAARALGQVGVAAFDQPLLELLHDADIHVRRAALLAAGQVGSRRLWPEVVAALAAPASAKAASQALIAAGPAALPAIDAAFAQADAPVQGRLAQVCGRIGGATALAILAAQIELPSPAARTQVLRALARCEYRPAPEARARLQRQLHAEVALAARLLAATQDCAGAALLRDALAAELHAARDRVLDLLGMLADAQAIARAHAPLRSASAEQRAYALEVIETHLDAEQKALALPLLSDLPPAQQLRQLATVAPQRQLGYPARLAELIADADGQHYEWTRVCAIAGAAMLGQAELADAIRPLCAAPEPLLRETAGWALEQLGLANAAPQNGAGAHTMLSRIEKVLILKTVAIFAETPDEVLADVAGLLHESEIPAGAAVFHKGDDGTSMFIIVDGEVRVHDGDHTLNHLHTRDVFGEMALLDPEPRVASVTALADTRLLRLDQAPFYELMDERNEVARGVIRVLTRYLRARVRDLGEVRAQLGEAAVTIRS